MDQEDQSIDGKEEDFIFAHKPEIDVYLNRVWVASEEQDPVKAGMAVADLSVYMFALGREFERKQ